MTTFDIYVRISVEGKRAPAPVAQLDLCEATCREWAERNGRGDDTGL